MYKKSSVKFKDRVMNAFGQVFTPSEDLGQNSHTWGPCKLLKNAKLKHLDVTIQLYLMDRWCQNFFKMMRPPELDFSLISIVEHFIQYSSAVPSGTFLPVSKLFCSFLILTLEEYFFSQQQWQQGFPVVYGKEFHSCLFAR